MTKAILTSSVLTVLCLAVSVWSISTPDPTDYGLHGQLCGICLFAGLALALTATVLSAVRASRLRQPFWAGVLAFLTLVAFAISCNGMSAFGTALETAPMSPDEAFNAWVQVFFPLAVLPLASLLSLALPQRGTPQPAARPDPATPVELPTEPPTGDQ